MAITKEEMKTIAAVVREVVDSRLEEVEHGSPAKTRHRSTSEASELKNELIQHVHRVVGSLRHELEAAGLLKPKSLQPKTSTVVRITPQKKGVVYLK